MPRGSEELTNSRKNEIISACAKLYETMSFKEITLKEIGEKTSFTPHIHLQLFPDKRRNFSCLVSERIRAVDPGSGNPVSGE